MKNDIFGLFRAMLFAFLIFAVTCLCMVEVGTHKTPKIEEAPEAEAQGADTAPQDCDPQTKTLQHVQIQVIKKNPEEAEPEPLEAPQPKTTEQDPEWISYGTYTLTAYCACETCCGYWATTRPLDENGNPIVYTASGARAEAGTTIAVDPSIIPYGSQVKINDHIYTAQDTGGKIKGNRIDIYFDSHEEAYAFGLQQAEVFIMREE